MTSIYGITAYSDINTQTTLPSKAEPPLPTAPTATKRPSSFSCFTTYRLLGGAFGSNLFER